MANVKRTKAVNWSSSIKKMQLNIDIPPTTMLRLRAFVLLLKLAVWVGGFGGVEFVKESDRQQDSEREQETQDKED